MKKVIKEFSKTEERMDYLVKNGIPTPLFTKILIDILSKGLTDRVLEITAKLSAPMTWSVHSRFTVDYSPVIIGLRLNPDTALGIVERGPLANLPEVS